MLMSTTTKSGLKSPVEFDVVVVVVVLSQPLADYAEMLSDFSP